MQRPVQIKVCGLTREEDIELLLSLGVDYCGFIVYPKSPRGLSIELAGELSALVPQGKRVAVDVETSPEKLKRLADAGFDYFQIHASVDKGLADLPVWSQIVGRERLWLAPRLSPESAFPEEVLQYADTILLDTYSSKQVGGTGQTGDWGRFLNLKNRYPDTMWILAGGLSPANAIEAVNTSGADHLDFNSGVEKAPGVKGHSKLRELFHVLRPGA